VSAPNRGCKTPDQLQHNTVHRQSIVFTTVQSLINCSRAGFSEPRRASEVVKVLGDREDHVACLQEVFGAVGKKHKLFWCGCQEKTEGVGIFLAENWVDQVVQIDRYNE